MRISPIFTQQSRLNSTTMGQAFQKTDCRKPELANSKLQYNRNDVFVRMAEASYSSSPRGLKIQSELQSMGLI